MVMDRAAAMVMDKPLVVVDPAESATCTTKLKAPEEPGVPVMAPVEEFNASPPGKLPVLTDQVYGVVPPVAASVWE